MGKILPDWSVKTIKLSNVKISIEFRLKDRFFARRTIDFSTSVGTGFLMYLFLKILLVFRLFSNHFTWAVLDDFFV